ncbi:MAG: hypothetical protein HKP25_15045 [Marinicaulis sp.]|nr:hypothetical protein [Marinicaulis sp.]
MTTAHYQTEAFKAPVVADQRILFALGVIMALAAFLAPPSPFIIDGGVYLDMARSMADHGALHIVAADAPEDAPALAKYLTHEFGGKIFPQYPSGYAILAAPFYMLFGVHGLMLLNAIGAGLSIWLTWRAAAKLYDVETARIAAALLCLATFLLNYSFSIWPHSLTLAICLAAVNFAIDGADEKDARQRSVKFALAGASIGVAINIRVDAILFAPILLVWMKLFARSHDRISPPAFLVGLIPGLVAASLLNDAKFGVFSPFSY